MQWAVALVRIYIMYDTVVLSRYCLAPHKGHLSKIQHLYVYLKKHTSTSINFNKETPDYKKFNTIEGNWGSLYAEEPEYLPHSCPPHMGKPVMITSFVDANLMADLNTGISHTIIIHLMNNTLI